MYIRKVTGNQCIIDRHMHDMHFEIYCENWVQHIVDMEIPFASYNRAMYARFLCGGRASCATMHSPREPLVRRCFSRTVVIAFHLKCFIALLDLTVAVTEM